MWRKVNLRGDRYSQIEALANAERRSVATMVDMLLERALVGQVNGDVGQDLSRRTADVGHVGQKGVRGGTV